MSSNRSDGLYSDMIHSLASQHKEHYTQQGMILSFAEYLALVREHPRLYMRNSASYLTDMFKHFGSRPADHSLLNKLRYRVFDHAGELGAAVRGGEGPQQALVKALQSFARLGRAFKLIVLHGPNGSSKSSTINCISHSMEQYSGEDEGAVYRFSWIFPKEKEWHATTHSEGPIGFSPAHRNSGPTDSFVGLEESQIACKIDSEFKENPLFLLPMPFRQQFLKSLHSTDAEDQLPEHILQDGLSKKNREIFEQLLGAYRGDTSMVYRHVQVERFYFSKLYRVGVSTVEPQIGLDARERQLTVDRYTRDLPSSLQTISFFEYSGELVESNRGLVEFSDFLKRPLESFKYLLGTIETGTIHLPSASALLDTVFVATTNDKHWDAFQEMPDFSSFFGRIHLIGVPYLLHVTDEMKIYEKDIELLAKDITIAPHTLYMLCLWAIMTRLKPAQTEGYSPQEQRWLKQLNALAKAKLYNDELLPPALRDSKEQQIFLKQNTPKLMRQYLGRQDYEGKTGASPRNIRDLLHRAAHSCKNQHLSALDIFQQLENLTKNKKLYDFLRHIPPGDFYQPVNFAAALKEEYLRIFEEQLLDSMSMVESVQYEKFLSRYIAHVVAHTRGEKIFHHASNSFVPPLISFMEEVEEILGIRAEDRESHRTSLLSRIAAWKIENPQKDYSVSSVFSDLLGKVKHHFFAAQERQVQKICHQIIELHGGAQEDAPASADSEQIEAATSTLAHLKSRYGYHEVAVVRSLRILLSSKTAAQKSAGASSSS